ncbi:MAG: hypothetical protein CMK59_00075 [Proteobacteria bacterium]|nr:hypothetical protein [Pseudomonadota bacterium]
MSFFFLLFCVLFPRLTLLVCYFFFDIPANTTPFWIDALGFFLFPRILIAYWGYNLNVSFLWLLALIGMELWEKKNSQPSQSESNNPDEE